MYKQIMMHCICTKLFCFCSLVPEYLLCRYNFFTFGHAVRQIEASRGAKEGNNAFVKVSLSEGIQVNREVFQL